MLAIVDGAGTNENSRPSHVTIPTLPFPSKIHMGDPMNDWGASCKSSGNRSGPDGSNTSTPNRRLKRTDVCSYWKQGLGLTEGRDLSSA